MRAVRGTEARIKAEPWGVHHYTPHQSVVIIYYILKKDEMCSPVVPHNDEKGYGWWSRAARILKTLWCKSPTDSRKKVPLLLFCIMFLTVRSMSQSSLHQNIIYIFFLLPWWTLHYLLATAAGLLRGRCSCYFCLSPWMSGATHIYVRAQRW